MSSQPDVTEFASSVLHLIQRFVGTQPDALAQMRSQVEAELTAAKEMVARAEAQLSAIEQMQSLIDQAPADEAPEAASTVVKAVAPPLRKAILQVLRERPGYWTRDDLWAELLRRGWGPGGKTPRNTFISRLSDLAKDGLIERTADRVRILEREEVPAT